MLSLRTARVFTFAMSCVCATGIDSILQSSATPSVDRLCREITPSRVHVMTAVGSRKALSASEMSALKHSRQGRMTHSATTGPSAILEERLKSSRRPPHFRVFFTDILLSPPRPITRHPSAVPAAIAPVEETERQSTKGGDNDTAEDSSRGREARKWCGVTARADDGKESPTERSSRKYRALPKIKME